MKLSLSASWFSIRLASRLTITLLEFFGSWLKSYQLLIIGYWLILSQLFFCYSINHQQRLTDQQQLADQQQLQQFVSQLNLKRINTTLTDHQLRSLSNQPAYPLANVFTSSQLELVQRNALIQAGLKAAAHHQIDQANQYFAQAKFLDPNWLGWQ